MWGMLLLVEKLLVSKEGLCSVKLVACLEWGWVKTGWSRCWVSTRRYRVFFLTASLFYTGRIFGHSVLELRLTSPRLWFPVVYWLSNSTWCHSHILKIETAVSFETMVPVCHCMIVTSHCTFIFVAAVGTQLIHLPVSLNYTMWKLVCLLLVYLPAVCCWDIKCLVIMLVKHALASVRSCETFSLVILFAVFLVQEFSAETTLKQIFFSGLCFPISSYINISSK
jgi:hypothetical protein